MFGINTCNSVKRITFLYGHSWKKEVEICLQVKRLKRYKNAHFSRVRAFRQGNLPLCFVANYVLLCTVQDAQCNTEESP